MDFSYEDESYLDSGSRDNGGFKNIINGEKVVNVSSGQDVKFDAGRSGARTFRHLRRDLKERGSGG